MKKTIYLIATLLVIISLSACSPKEKQSENKEQDNNKTTTETTETTETTTKVGVIAINSEEFEEIIFDYKKNKEWKYKGVKPCVIDFYADWCRPCKIVAPILEELSLQYKDQINFYKINVDSNRDLAATMGIQSLPSIVFIPLKEQPQMSVGAMPKDGYINAINKIILQKK